MTSLRARLQVAEFMRTIYTVTVHCSSDGAKSQAQNSTTTASFIITTIYTIYQMLQHPMAQQLCCVTVRMLRELAM